MLGTLKLHIVTDISINFQRERKQIFWKIIEMTNLNHFKIMKKKLEVSKIFQ